MKLIAENRGTVILDACHLVASGGEGSVYAKGGEAYKLYHQPRDLSEKIRLLHAFAHPGVVHPRGALRDEQGGFVGYWMERRHGTSLPNLFAEAWRKANHFGTAETTKTVLAMREIVSFAHSRQALLVDANEFNWLVDGTTPWVIDVDSWQVGPYQANALMPSIRDWSATEFSEYTDWFAWGIVTFQIFIGIHPYKGIHPAFGRGKLVERMMANASIFDAGVRLNSAVRSLDEVPARLREWYRATFQEGVRTLPPATLDDTGLASPGYRRTYHGDAVVSVTRLSSPLPPAAKFPATYVAHDRMLRIGGRLFAVVNDSDRGLIELDEAGIVRTTWPVMANATVFFHTAAWSNYLGQPYLLTVADQVNIFPAAFLRAQKILDIFSDNGIFAIVLAQDPRTALVSRYLCRLEAGQWCAIEQEHTEETFINAASNGGGIVGYIPGNGELRVYSSRTFAQRQVQSAAVKAEMILEELNGQIGFRSGGLMYRLQVSARGA